MTDNLKHFHSDEKLEYVSPNMVIKCLVCQKTKEIKVNELIEVCECGGVSSINGNIFYIQNATNKTDLSVPVNFELIMEKSE